MKKPQGTGMFSVNRREFLEFGLAGSLLPAVSASRGEVQQAKASSRGPGWMDGRPLVISSPWQAPLYAHRTGGWPLWQDQDWEYGFSEEAAKEMKDMGVTATIVPIFQGYGSVVEGSYIEKSRKAAALWHRYGIKVGGYIGSTIHYETFLLENPGAHEWLVPDYLGHPVIYGNRPNRRWPYFMHPGYRECVKRALRIAIEEVKVDLFSFDHTSMQADPRMFQHPLAIEDFRNFLRTKHKPEELKTWLGTSDLRYVVPPRVDWRLSTIDDRLFQEWMDLRCQMLARYYEEMAAFIHSLNPAVCILSNPDVGLSGINTVWYQGVDYPRLIPHMQAVWSEEGNYPGVTGEGVLISEIRTYKMTSMLGARTVTYTGVPYVGLPPDENHMKLQMAQAMAHSRQCLGDIGPIYSLRNIPEGPRKYIRFFHSRFDLYGGVESAAEVAVLHSYASLATNNDRPYQSTWLFEQSLIQSQIPFDIIFDQHLENLSRYRVLVLADQECLDEKQCDLIRRYVQGGGGLVATEFTSLFTARRVRQRDYGLADLFQVPPPAFVLWVKDNPLAISAVRNEAGRGRVAYVPEVKPAIEKPLGEAMTSRYWKLPLNSGELIEAVKWAAGGRMALEVKAPLTVTAELQRQAETGKLILHLINYDVERTPRVENIEVRVQGGSDLTKVSVISPDEGDLQTLAHVRREGALIFTVPSLKVYDVVVISSQA